MISATPEIMKRQPSDHSNSPLFRYERSPDRGRCLVACRDIQEGRLIFVERPLIALQSVGNVCDGALVCSHCMAFCGSPQQALQVAADPDCLPEIATTKKQSITRPEHDLVPCRHGCGHMYCSLECQRDDWERGGHGELCTGWIPETDPAAMVDPESTAHLHPLVRFKLHARESNEIFLLIAVWLVRILKQNVPYHEDDNDNTHPYTDFMMNPWWDVKTKDLLKTDPGAFAEAISLEKTLKNLCHESHSFLHQALPEEYRQSPWLTPLGMARLIGSLEQNCLGIRRKHAVHRDIMEDADLRQEMHQQIIRCLENAGMIGSDGDRDSEDDGEDEDGDESKKGDPNDEQDDKATDQSDLLEGEWDYSRDDIAQFLAGFPTHEKVDMDDEWDEVFRPLDGTAHFTIATKMNHSCDPNAILLYKSRGWGRYHPLVAYCVALRDIAPGEELTICYIDANEPYEKRQEALANYGFICACVKCEKEKTGSVEVQNGHNLMDEDHLFGCDDDEEASEENEEEMTTQPEKQPIDERDGDTKLKDMAERIDTVLNKSVHAAIPIAYLAPVSNHVVHLGTKVENDLKRDCTSKSQETVQSLLKQCLGAIKDRDFAACCIVGADLESFLYTQLKSRGSWSDPALRVSYWCAALTASIGYANDGSFLIAMHFLDKGVVLGVKSAEISGFFTYVEHFASQMALGPCPPATVCSVLDYQSAPYKHILICNGLSKPIEFPVDEVASDTTAISNMLHTSEKCIPFVIRNLASDWPSMKKWRDIAALSREYGHRLIPVEIGNMASGMSESIVCFRHFVEEYLTASTAKEIWSVQDATSDASQIAYLAQHPLLDQIPALYSDVEQNPCGVNPTNVNVWMGTGGTRTPLHFDSYDNLLVQVVGAKYVRLYAREHTSKLYVSKNKSYGLQGNMSDLNCEMEDFEKHPKAEDCPYQEVLLLPGDCLFIPSQHWHYVRSLSTSISVNYWF